MPHIDREFARRRQSSTHWIAFEITDGRRWTPLANCAKPHYIKNERGAGYVFITQVDNLPALVEWEKR